MNRYTKSQEWLAHARRVTPGGAQTLSKMAERFPEGAYPAFLEYGSGPKVVDIDGNEYLDYICGLGAITLGYSNDTVDEAVAAYLGAPSFSLPHMLETEVAEKLANLIPCAEMVRFTKTGSEASEAAIRVARAVTGRDVILTCGYHSWHSWYAATQRNHPGVPKWMGQLSVLLLSDLMLNTGPRAGVGIIPAVAKEGAVLGGGETEVHEMSPSI